MVTTNHNATPAFSTPNEREFVATAAFAAPRQLVFDAWTNPKHLSRWLLGPDGWTMPVCEIDLCPGGKWHFAWRDAGGNEMHMHGEYREIVSPERVVSTENWGDPWPETLNMLSFVEEQGWTTMTVKIRYPSKDARDAALATGMKDGMAMSFNRLAEYLWEIQ